MPAKCLTRALEVAPDDPEANYSLGMVFAQTDDTAASLRISSAGIEGPPGLSRSANNLGILYLVTTRRDEAVASFEQCIRVAPAFDQAYLNLARVYAIEGAREKARAVLRPSETASDHRKPSRCWSNCRSSDARPSGLNRRDAVRSPMVKASASAPSTGRRTSCKTSLVSRSTWISTGGPTIFGLSCSVQLRCLRILRRDRDPCPCSACPSS